MADEINVGDVVQLKSGSPEMTVDKIAKLATMSGEGPLSAWCTYFDTKGVEKKGTYPVTSLKKK